MLVAVRMLRTATVLFGSLATYHRLRQAGLYIPRCDFQTDLEQSLVALFRPMRPRPASKASKK